LSVKHRKSRPGSRRADRAGPRHRQLRGEATRQRVIEAAIDAFGEHGFEGTSTRALVRRAGTSLVAIHYHFGGKAQLHRAAAEYIAGAARERVNSWIADARTVLERPDASREQLMETLWRLFQQFFADVLAGRPAGGLPDSWRRFVLREQREPTAAFEIVFASMRPFYETIFALIGRIIGRPARHPEVRLLTIMIFGQIAVFRTNRIAAMRLLGWPHLREAEQWKIQRIAKRQVFRLLAAQARKRSNPIRLPARFSDR
jgi:TetR/AcrR family transcriptional regulator, regulator of cefoperazone and chloramphenicol sensitivity